MNLSVLGLGMVSRIGTTQALEAILDQDQIDPEDLSKDHSLSIDIPDSFNISPQLIRRMGHFAKISLLSACYALRDSGLGELTGKSIGIIQGSVYGPIISGIQAFDDLIDFGDNQLSPTNFSGSVFNASSTYLSLAFGIQGPVLTHTSGRDTLYNSLLAASLWLESETVDYVILGIGDEYTTYFDHDNITGAVENSLLPTCEGWTTFIFGRDEKAKYSKVGFNFLKTLSRTENQKNIYSLWHEQLRSEEFINHAKGNQPCFPALLRGSYPGSVAFDLALALICAKKERFPVFNPLSGNYQMQLINKNDPIYCCSISESNGVFCYELINDELTK